jgi:hypothetical protein
MNNVVQLLADSTIYAVRTGRQTEGSIRQLCSNIKKLASMLRDEDKLVLILCDVADELPMSIAAERLVIELGKELDFDYCAFFPVSGQAKSVRDVKVRINSFDVKVRNFASKEEAVGWLQYMRCNHGKAEG